MTQKFTVDWSKIARKDFFQIIEYISLNNPAAAKRALQKIQEKAQQLNVYPERCRIVPELQRQGIFQYRELIIDHWRVIFKITRDQVLVVSVIDSRRNLEDILLQRLLEINHENPFS
jgi:plasmid stabilization system protein ParE